ncbi:MAG: hypothetical protein FRX49_05828 [Trebouxia sp. A1-2]|nr:MAG: hypothetical protein FRX49_05828 [Trebouxia sp. A1-2]
MILGGKELASKRRVTFVRTRCGTKPRAVDQSTGESATALAADMTKTKVLFVCLGNICRSPTAEAVFKAVVKRSNVQDEFFIDSCGTGGGNEDWYKVETKDGWAYHVGDDADERMTAAAQKRDIHLTSKSRPLEPEDFQKFEFIIGMDAENIKAIKKAAAHWKDILQKPLPKNWEQKVQLMSTYLTKAEYKELKEVPDPYFGGPEGFEKVLDLLEDACEGFLSHIESRKFATES